MKLSEEQLQQIIAAIGCGKERSIKQSATTSACMPAGAKATIIPCSENSRRELTTVGVVSVSDTGIDILNGVPMRVGDNFVLRIPSTNGQPSVAILCSVVKVQRNPAGLHAIGARFARILTIPGEQVGDAKFEPPIVNLDDQGLAHLREVEGKLSQRYAS